jgi:uncharacterized Zn-binding protein involved in type VI secretion
MRPFWRTLSCALGTGGLVLSALAAGQGVAAAAPRSAGTYICTGTLDSPGTLAGSYGDVIVTGACVIDAGPVHVHGDLTVAPGADLTAIFGQDDLTDSGNSNLVVNGNLIVRNGASVMLGCYSLFVNVWGSTATVSVPDFPCFDDPSQSDPTLNTHDVIDGDVLAYDPLGLVMHQDVVHGNLIQYGGGAGLGCANVGIFNKYFGLPDYSDFANNRVGGDLRITGLDTCWDGFFRNHVRGNAVISRNTSTADGTEVGGNVVFGNMACDGNNPAVQLGDSNSTPNKVGGWASGQCGFGVVLENPPPEAGVTVPPTYQPASVPLRHHHHHHG